MQRADLPVAVIGADPVGAARLLERGRIVAEGDRLRVLGTEGGRPVELMVDRVIVATGFRPDLSLLSTLRLSLDPVVEATPALAPLIDPNLHSCGTVRPHGVVELSHRAGFLHRGHEELRPGSGHF